MPGSYFKVLFGLKHCIYGLENLPSGSKILAANHPNASDGLQLPLILAERVTVILQENLLHLPFFGWILTHSGHIPVCSHDRRVAFDQACKALKEGKTILIFPEGTLNPENREVRVGTGAVRLSLATGVPIVPVGILVSKRDTLKIGPIGKFQSGRWQFRGKFRVRLGSAWIPGQESSQMPQPCEIQELTRCLMNRIYALVQQTAEEESS
jgi:1-acyl-sn-glycerol-3-phosphate acyltransferase